jgi:hypothetical protein
MSTFKKRNRNPLLPMVHETRQNVDRKPSYFLETRATEVTTQKTLHQYAKNHTALESQYNYGPTPSVLFEPEQSPLLPGMSGERRHAIKYLFCQVFGSPPRDNWADWDVIGEIILRYNR